MQTEEIALEVDGLPGREQAQHLDRLIEPPTARGRVDAGVGDLATVLAAGAHAERQPAWSDLGDRGELARDRERMAQRELIDADQHRQRRLGRQREGRGDDTVEALAAVEADVVTDDQEVEARAGDALQERLRCFR